MDPAATTVSPPSPESNNLNQTSPAAEVGNPLEIFAQNLLLERGVMEFDADLVEGMKQDIMERLELLTTQTMIAGLKDADLDQFEKMVEDGASPAQLQAFAEEKVPDLGQNLTEALVRFRNAYLGSAA